MRSVNVYNNDIFAGVLTELDDGRYSFRYDDEYYRNGSMVPENWKKSQQQQI